MTDSTPSPFYIVGVGASAGGLEALEQFFRHMPTSTGMAFVVVQHLSPNFQSLMNELLARHTSMAIFQVSDGIEVKPNTIYLIPPRQNLTLENNHLRLTEQVARKRQVNFPIDIFFNSLAEEKGAQAIGIVLSGTGSDGSRGIVTISQNNGLVMVQTPETAGFDGMPKNALATNHVDVVAPPDQLPGSLVEYQLDHDAIKKSKEAGDLDEENELSIIFALLRQKFQIDFSYYKLATILRRIQRRVTFSESLDMETYVRRLREDEAEIDLLYRDLLVEVTEFFRDSEAFKVLSEEIIPEIVDNMTEGTIRAWVPGCATGEEAYSMAMLFDNYCRQFRPNAMIKIFATDIHQTSLEIASTGIYSADRIANLPEDLRRQYFSEQNDGSFRVSKTLRAMVVFAPHNLTQDPPFTRLHFISCRNVLIYLRQSTQQKILRYFHFGLLRNSYLFLGPSENTGELKDEFDMVNRRWRIFRKRRDVRLGDRPDMQKRRQAPRSITSYTVDQPLLEARRSAQMQNWQEALLNEYVPPSLLVNQRFELQHVFGDAGKYLRSLQGRTTLDVTQLVIATLHTAVRAALHRAASDEETVSYKGVRISADDEPASYVQLTVEPFSPPRDERHYLISLQPLKPSEKIIEELPAKGESFAVDEASAEQIALLERELQYTKEHLQATVEELETTNEELQSTNEELVASNEELQSTNEELHSVNEELYTVNSEYQQKITDMLQATNDMQNIQRSSGVCTIFLDRDHRIRDFSPHAGEVFNLMPQDVGRPIEHLLYNLNISGNELFNTTAAVLESAVMVEHEVTLPTGEMYLMRIRPYKTETNVIEGVVLALTDITEIKKADKERGRSKMFVDLLYEISSHPSRSAKQQLEDALQMATEALGLDMGVISHVKDDISTMNFVYSPGNLLSPGDQFDFAETYCAISLQNEHVVAFHNAGKSDYADHPAYKKFGLSTHIGTRVFVDGVCFGALNLSQRESRDKPFDAIEADFVRQLGVWVGGELELILADEEIARQTTRLEGLVRAVRDPLISANKAREIVFINDAFVKQFGYTEDEVLGRTMAFLYNDIAVYREQKHRRFDADADFDTTMYEIEYKRKDDSIFLTETSVTNFIDDQGKTIGFFKQIRDISQQRVRENRVRHQIAGLRASFNLLPTPLILLLPDGSVLDANSAALGIGNISLNSIEQAPLWEAPWWRDSAETRTLLKSAVAQAAAGNTFQDMISFNLPGSETNTLNLTIAPLHDAESHIRLLVVSGQLESQSST